MNRPTAMTVRGQFNNVAKSIKHGVSRIGAKVAAGTAAMLATGAAFAQDADLGAAATTAISGAKTTVAGILLILVGVAFLFVLYRLIVKAK